MKRTRAVISPPRHVLDSDDWRFETLIPQISKGLAPQLSHTRDILVVGFEGLWYEALPEPNEEYTVKSMSDEDAILDAAKARMFLENQRSIDLNEVTSISDDALELLAKHEGAALHLGGLTELPDTAAEELSKFQGSLYLDGLAKLSGAAAEALAQHRGRLSLDGLTELSGVVAEALATHKGELFLGGLTDLSDSAAEGLSIHDDRLLLAGVKTISPEVAFFVGKHPGPVELKNLATMSDEAAEMLVKGIKESGRHADSQISLGVYEGCGITENAGSMLLDVLTFVELSDEDALVVDSALKAFVKAAGNQFPAETREFVESLSTSDDVEEVLTALERLQDLALSEGLWVKILKSKNTLGRLMELDPDGLDFEEYGPPECRVPLWKALSDIGDQFPKVRELTKLEARKVFQGWDFAHDLTGQLTANLVPIIEYGTDQVRYYDKSHDSEDPILQKQEPLNKDAADLMAELSEGVMLEIYGLEELPSDVASALSRKRGTLRFYGLKKLEKEIVAKLTGNDPRTCIELRGGDDPEIIDGTIPDLQIPDDVAESLLDNPSVCYIDIRSISRNAAMILSSRKALGTNLDLEAFLKTGKETLEA